MAKDLFEEEDEKKETSTEAETAPDDDEAWIPLDDEELELSPIDDETDGLTGEDEETEVDIIGEIEASTEEEDEAFADDEKADGPLEDEEINFEDIAEGYTEEDEEVEADSDNVTDQSFEDEEFEPPPWDEGVEIPVHGATGSPKRKKVFVFGGILFFTALVVIGLYAFLKPGRMQLIDNKVELKGEEPSFITKKMEKMPIKEAEPEENIEKRPAPEENIEKKSEPEEILEKRPAPERAAIEENTAPNISGTPVTSVAEGTHYSFMPKASDMDTGDKLTFFIANQPAWTIFDINTGALTGTPRSSDIGTYENIVIMVSDGKATALLPAFNITVTGVAPVIAKEKEAPKEKMVIETKSDKKTGPQQQPSVKKEAVKIEEVKKEEIVPYTLPDLTGLVKQSEIQGAALGYYNEVKKFLTAYTLKLEVDCLDDSVITAFRQGNFDRRIFILPKEINGKHCFVVCWGLYTTKNEALKALSSIPSFFSNQATKPQLVMSIIFDMRPILCH